MSAESYHTAGKKLITFMTLRYGMYETSLKKSVSKHVGNDSVVNRDE